MFAALLSLSFSRMKRASRNRRSGMPVWSPMRENGGSFSMVLPILRYEEGFRSSPYYCSEGYPTIGYGHLCSTTKWDSLSTCPSYISKSDAEQLLIEEVNAKTGSMSYYSNIMAAYNACGDRRKAILVSMAFQLGTEGLSYFQNTLRLISQRRWDDAAEAMLDSAWARQTPNRAQRHAEVMRSNTCAEYGWY